MDEIPLEKIIRSRRSTIALEITSGATLVVRAPLRASSSDIREIIRQKRSWIQRKMNEIKRRPLTPIHEYADGSCSFFSGVHTRCTLWKTGV